MNAVPQEILKEYVKSQNFASTAEIMEAMKEMFRDVIQTVMEVELDEEMGRERCQRAEASGDTPNYRNGHTKETVKTQLGKVEIQVPRDRNGSFEPKIIGKYSRNVDGMEDKILSLYSCGMSQRDISEQIKELYDVEISPEYEYPPEIRKIIYTTNIIEVLNRQFRQITKNKPSFTSDDSLRRMLYLASQRIVKHWHARCQNWDLVLSQLELLFAGRTVG